MPNWFAYAMLAIWPMIALSLYRSKTATEATLWTIIGGLLLLPSATSVDLPLIPALGKNSISILTAWFGCHYLAKKRVSIFGGRGLVRWLLIIFIIGPFFTAELNTDAINIGGQMLPPMTLYDALSGVINQLIVIAPFFLGRQLFRKYEEQLLMFRILIISGLFYSIPILIEIRMSPQLHNWIYGFTPGTFLQHVRFSGYRPVVFMGHGLMVAFLTAVALISAAVFWQSKLKLRQFNTAGVAYYLLLMLLLCKSVAALIYGFGVAALIKFVSFKNQLRIARVLVLIALLYPTLSIMNVFPQQTLLSWAEALDTERAQSLNFRFDNEKILLDHASHRFFFGWGTWGRNRVYNEDTGKDESVTDGRWIVTMGTFGWMGFITEFGLLAMPVLRAIASFKFAKSSQEKTLLSAHALLVSIIMIDQLPNSSLGGWLWLIAGILLGRAEDLVNGSQANSTNKFINKDA